MLRNRLVGMGTFVVCAAHAQIQCTEGIQGNCSNYNVSCGGGTGPVTINVTCTPTCAASGRTPTVPNLSISAYGTCQLGCVPSITQSTAIDGGTGAATIIETAVSKSTSGYGCLTENTVTTSSTCGANCTSCSH